MWHREAKLESALQKRSIGWDHQMILFENISWAMLVVISMISCVLLQWFICILKKHDKYNIRSWFYSQLGNHQLNIFVFSRGCSIFDFWIIMHFNNAISTLLCIHQYYSVCVLSYLSSFSMHKDHKLNYIYYIRITYITLERVVGCNIQE